MEAWLTLASMLRLTTVCEWSRPVQDGWEARVFVRDGANNVIGAAEAQCLKTERTKKSWEDYAIRSMAQTRATSKALRSVLGFIMVLAGYQATPAEEMPDNPEPPAKAPETPQERGPSVGQYKAAWEAAGRPGGSGRAFMMAHGGTIAGAMAALENLEQLRAEDPAAQAFHPDPEPEPQQPLLRAVPDEDPLEKERGRMWALSKDRGVRDDVRRAMMLRLFGSKCIKGGKPTSTALNHAQLVQLNFEISEYSG